MRRPKDEPRMWTEGVPVKTVAIRALSKLGELQAAIDEVVTVSQFKSLRDTWEAVRTLLCPLATKKEETNG